LRSHVLLVGDFVLFRPLLAAAFVAALTVPALAADFAVDANHTQATFTVTHLAISRVTGKVPVTAGTVSIGSNDVPTAISMTLSAKDIDTQSAGRDRDLRGADWFEVDKFPTMTFTSKTIAGTPQALTITGDLTMHGVTKPVTFTAKEIGKMTDARNRVHVGYSANTTLDRRQWGLNFGAATPGGSLVAGNDVTIDLNVEIIGPAK
jgi:polyisoprenoid-binding protein YceI